MNRQSNSSGIAPEGKKAQQCPAPLVSQWGASSEKWFTRIGPGQSSAMQQKTDPAHGFISRACKKSKCSFYCW
jgi:hypothetical protein